MKLLFAGVADARAHGDRLERIVEDHERVTVVLRETVRAHVIAQARVAR